MRFSLSLIGTFKLCDPDGTRIPIRSKRSIALLGILAISNDYERSRVWLQEKLWGSRENFHSQGSLRRELSNLRKITRYRNMELIAADTRNVWLVNEHVHVMIDSRPDMGPAIRPEFLEGIDIPGEEAFEDWLRDMRSLINSQSTLSDLVHTQLGRAARL